ncbi:MAG: hypothetical protein ACJA1C_001186 [Crocinitomicaceae bacterium]|jgi:uncharacterized protein YndB with AHSA1/START domain
MNYTSQVIIDAPIDKVIILFDNPENMSKWQEGFISMTLKSGEDRKPGAKYDMKYKMGKREIEMVETILEHDLPRIFSATYEAKNMWNQVDNSFHPTEDGKTLYTTDNTFKMRGMMKIIGILMPGAFKKQSQKFLNDFKTYVEKEVSNNQL